MQPVDDVNPYLFAFFAAFVYIASFVGLQLFVIVGIDARREHQFRDMTQAKPFKLRLRRYADDATLPAQLGSVNICQTILMTQLASRAE